MGEMKKFLYFLAFEAAVMCSAGPALAQTSPSLYTKAQAQAGATLYVQNCAMCHGDAVAGKTLIKGGGNPTIGGIFSFMIANMPPSQPGGLSHQQYEDIMAYALQKNLYPAGTHGLNYNQTLQDTRPFVNKQQ